MKILVTTQNFYPDSFLINDIVERLVLDGHDVTVLTGLPDYSTGEIPDKYKNNKSREETIFGAKVIRVNIMPRKTGVLNRILNYASFAINSVRKIETINPDFDVIFAYQTSPVSMAHPAVKAGKKWGIPVLLYCLDIWPEAVKTWNLNERNPIYSLVSAYSNKLYSGVDYIAVGSKPFIKYLETKHSNITKKIFYLPQHAPCFDNTAKMNVFKDDKLHFVFAGNIGSAQKTQWILEAAKELMKLGNTNYINSWQIDIFGEGSEFDKLKATLETYDLSDQIVLHGRVSKEELNYYYADADVFLLTLQQDNAIGETLPAKLQGYMAAGKPIVAMATGAVEQVLRESKAGVCIKAYDYKSMAKAMNYYISNDKARMEDGENALKYFHENFTLEVFMESYYRIIHNI